MKYTANVLPSAPPSTHIVHLPPPLVFRSSQTRGGFKWKNPLNLKKTPKNFPPAAGGRNKGGLKQGYGLISVILIFEDLDQIPSLKFITHDGSTFLGLDP